ncbi:hypothetical protein ACIRRA_44610 [Nocardia sp. NPDC101769]|uniref:hypothetical protein n=1 Tax=Nocardia sp. NPDC101769 TaxID=3364333 RepID=UPI0037F8A82A
MMADAPVLGLFIGYYSETAQSIATIVLVSTEPSAPQPSGEGPEADEAQPQPSPASAEPPEPPAADERPGATSPAPNEPQARGADRSGRYALVTALSAALLSGVVSAGVAVYVSANQLDRTAQLTAESTLRADRQKAYADFLNCLGDIAKGMGGLKGVLTAYPHDRHLVNQAVKDFGDAVSAGAKAENVVAVAGTDGMWTVITDYRDNLAVPLVNEVAAFSVRYVAAGGAGENDDTGMDRASAALVTTINGYTDKIGKLIHQFVDQAREDLHTS